MSANTEEDMDQRTDQKAPANHGQDIAGGIALVIIGLLAFYLLKDLPFSSPVGFTSGSAPRLFAAGVTAMGALIAIVGWFKRGSGVEDLAMGSAALGLAVGCLGGIIYLFGNLGLSPWISRICIAAATAIALVALAKLDGFPAQSRYGLRASVSVLGSVLFFAVTIRTLGLLLCGIPMVMIATFAIGEFRPFRSLLFAIAVTVFCTLLFPLALGLPLPMWPAL